MNISYFNNSVCWILFNPINVWNILVKIFQADADYFFFNEDKDAQFFITVHGGRYCNGR